MIFFLCAFVFMFIGRKLGWALSRPLYFAPLATVSVFSLFWGIAIAVSIRGLVVWQEPGALLRWIMGYALGAYVAIPNYGLFNEATMPAEATTRHSVLKAVPLLTYVASSIVLFAIFRTWSIA